MYGFGRWKEGFGGSFFGSRVGMVSCQVDLKGIILSIRGKRLVWLGGCRRGSGWRSAFGNEDND